MTKAIVVAFHKYTPFGGEFYEPMLSFFLQQMQKFKDAYGTLYLIDSTWGISPTTHHLPLNVIVIRVDPSWRYYDAYKWVLPQVKEDLVLFVDNDTIIYKEEVINKTFSILEGRYEKDSTNWVRDVVSIYDTIGEHTFEELGGKSKFCPYFFAAKKDLLMKYLEVDWGSAMPEHETLGKLTQVMLADGVRPYEWPEDKSNCLYDGTQDGEMGKGTGLYHVRAGSTPAYLLATKEYGNKETYWKYLKEQPKSEYLRQCACYKYMGGKPYPIYQDVGISHREWGMYQDRFEKYHNLP